MPPSVLDMSVSLDGYIADPDDFLGGEDGERLHKWADADAESGRAVRAGLITAGCRSSCRATGRPARPHVGAIRW